MIQLYSQSRCTNGGKLQSSLYLQIWVFTW